MFAAELPFAHISRSGGPALLIRLLALVRTITLSGSCSVAEGVMLIGRRRWTVEQLDNSVVLVPVLDDWLCFAELGKSLATQWPRGEPGAVVAIDDGSLHPPSEVSRLHEDASNAIGITLGRNLGHQRAIAVGLVFLASQPVTSPVIVMDSDGEDRPEALNEIWEAHLANPEAVIVAQRRNRTENVRFRFLYRAYRFAYRVLTGHRLDFGKFVLLSVALTSRTRQMRIVHAAGRCDRHSQIGTAAKPE